MSEPGNVLVFFLFFFMYTHRLCHCTLFLCFTGYMRRSRISMTTFPHGQRKRRWDWRWWIESKEWSTIYGPALRYTGSCVCFWSSAQASLPALWIHRAVTLLCKWLALITLRRLYSDSWRRSHYIRSMAANVSLSLSNLLFFISLLPLHSGHFISSNSDYFDLFYRATSSKTTNIIL